MKVDFDEFCKKYPTDIEIAFYFESEGKDIVHYVGNNGTDFKTLDELLNAKIYDEKKLLF